MPDDFKAENTPINDFRDFGEALTEVKGHVRQIPGLINDQQRISERVIRLDEQVGEVKRQVENVQERVDTKLSEGHNCYQVDALSKFDEALQNTQDKLGKGIEEGIKTRERLRPIAEEIKTFRGARLSFFIAMISVIITILLAVGSAVWFISDLNRQVQYDRNVQERQTKEIRIELKEISRKSDTHSVLREIRSLGKTVKLNGDNDVTFDYWWKQLSPREKRNLKKTIGAKKLPNI